MIMEDLDLKARQEEDLKRKIRKNQLNLQYRRNVISFYIGLIIIFVILAIIFVIIPDTLMSVKVKCGIFIVVACGGMIILSYIFGRCPHCDELINISFYMMHCPYCGENLEVTKSLTQIEKKRQAENEKQNI